MNFLTDNLEHRAMHFTKTKTALWGGLFFLQLLSPAHGQQSTHWWTEHETKPGFIEALAEFKLSPQKLNSNPEQALQLSSDQQEPLYWLRRTLQQYSDSAQSTYNVPVTEIHSNGKKRTGMSGRYGFFTTHIFMNASETVQITRQSADSGVTCSAWTGTSFKLENHMYDKVVLPPEMVQYTAARSGTLLLSCEDSTRDMQSTGKLIAFKVKNIDAQQAPMFIFGMDSKQDWMTRFSQTPIPLGEVLLYNGRARISFGAAKAKALANTDIMYLMREHLLMPLEYDRVNGFNSNTPADPLNLPTPGLVNASYESCCSASGGQGSIRIGFSKTTPPTSWGYWHEYGHLNQVEWSWGGLTEVTVNLYSIAACRRLKGEFELKACSTDQDYVNRTWDRESVGNYLTSGQPYKFDNMDKGTEFLRSVMFNQLLATYDDLYPQLGRAFRKEYNYASNTAAFNTDAKKKDWFVINASRFSGHDLRGFFDKWGVIYSDEARATVASLKLPPPIQPVKAYTHPETWAISANRATKLQGKMIDDKAKHIAYIAYSEKEGPTKLVWANSTYSTLTVPVWDEAKRMSQVKFRAARSNGKCGRYSLNSTASCSSPGSSFWNIYYHPEDNPGLTGINKGRIQLAARDWKVTDWGSQLDIPFTVTGTNH